MSEFKSVLEIQEGGTHYRDKGIQPVEYAHANDLNFFQANVVKYVTRYKDKKGVEDLKKAIHYLQMILEFEYSVLTDFSYSDSQDTSKKELQGWEGVPETPEKVIVIPPYYQNPDNDEDREVRDFYITRAKESGIAVAFGSKENVYKESGSEDQSDISQEELKIYIDSVVESEKEKLWYPPVEDGENPWIEWHPAFWDICPEGVSESTVVDVLMDYEREEEEFETSPQKARDWYWGDSSIVAYRVV